MGYLNYLKEESSLSTTMNGAVAYTTTGSDCLNLFSTIGTMRGWTDEAIIAQWDKAWAEDELTALKILFYARDIRGGLGERRVFRVILNRLAEVCPGCVLYNLEAIPYYGRYDDVLPLLLNNNLRKSVSDFLRNEISCDWALCAKWLPSINTSSKNTRRLAKELARSWGMSDKEYRKLLSEKRKNIGIIEHNLVNRDYTFDYSKQPSKAMFKYRKAFMRNDEERYCAYLDSVIEGKEKINTKTLMPYEITNAAFLSLNKDEIKTLDVMWNNLPDYTNGDNALVVMDGSGSMTWGSSPYPIDIASSLAIYFADKNKGYFHNHFMTFSYRPKLIEIKGKDIHEKVCYCRSYDECANTNLENTFKVLLDAAVKNNVPQEELPKTLYIISDMEFDEAALNPNKTIFQSAKKMFNEAGYELPTIVFWRVSTIGNTVPVREDERGVVLVSGCSATLFKQVITNDMNPYEFMRKVLYSDRYRMVGLPETQGVTLDMSHQA